jgi:hypothetical protein
MVVHFHDPLIREGVARQKKMPKVFITEGQIGAEFRRYFDQRRLKRAEEKVVAKYESLIRASVQPPEMSAGGTIESHEMYGYLDFARKLEEDELRQHVQLLSSFQWLWFLRHLPLSIWHGKLRTTPVYDCALAEILSAQSATSAVPQTNRLLRYPVNGSTADLVSEFVAGVRYLSQIHTNLRWAGKGVEFSLNEGVVGRAIPAAETKRAVELYDARVEAAQMEFLGTIGSIVSSESRVDCSSEIVAVGVNAPETNEPVRNRRFAAGAAKYATECRFAVGWRCLDELAKLNDLIVSQGARWWPDELPLLVGFLRAAKGLVESDLGSMLKVLGLGWVLTNIETVDTAPNYVIEDAAAVVTRVFPGVSFPSSYRSLFDAVAKIKGNAWSVGSGPALRTEGNLVCIDLYASTTMLFDFAEFSTRGGVEGDIRGRHFESAVQAIIDLSSWAPPEELRQDVGRPIRIAKKDLTDLDAIGLKGRTLMLVSCKSRIYSRRFDQGDPQTIQATANVAQDALARWREVKAVLEANPRCIKGVDFSNFEILPVICLPHVPYLPIGPATDFAAPGLRAVVSVSELQHWLNEQT